MVVDNGFFINQLYKHMNKLFTTILALAALMPTANARTVQGQPWPGPVAPMKAAALTSDDDLMNPTPPDGEDQGFDASLVENWSGSGSQASYLVIQWNSAGENYARVFGYRYDGTKYGIDMINAVVASNPQLYFLTHLTDLGYTVAGFGWDADCDRNIALVKDGEIHTPDHSTSAVTTTAYNYDSWTAYDADDIWQSGWYSGYWSYWCKDSFDEEFGYSPLGASSRELSEGSVDGWMFTSFSGGDNSWKELYAEPAAASGETFTANGVTYRVLNSSKNAVEVIGATSDFVDVPATVSNGGANYSVLGVADGAFKGSNVRFFSAASLSYIGDKAFENATNLATVIVNGGALAYVGDRAFAGCDYLSQAIFPADWKPTDLTGVSIFDSCAGLSAVPFPEGFGYIPDAYYAGTGISSYTIPATVNKIGEYAFSGCYLMSDFTVERLTPPAIPAGVFAGIKADATLHVPAGSADAYRNATGWSDFANIEEIKEPASVGTKFQVGDYWYCVTSTKNSEVEVAYPGDTPAAFAFNLQTPYVLPDATSSIAIMLRIPVTVTYDDIEYKVTGIGDFAFINIGAGNNATNLKYIVTLVAPNDAPAMHIKHLGRYAFASTKNFVSVVNVPTSVESLGAGVFYNSNITQLQLTGEGECKITEIPDSAFNGWMTSCPLVTDKVTRLGKRAFDNSYRIKLPDFTAANLEYLGDECFATYGDLGGVIKLSDKLSYLGKNGFGATTLDVPDNTLTLRSGVTYGTYTFGYAKGFTKVYIEDGIEAVPDYMFWYNSRIEEVRVPSTLKTIGTQSFNGTTALKAIELPEGLESMGESAFSGSGLVEVTVPGSVKTIPAFCFSSCSNLKRLTLEDGVETLERRIIGNYTPAAFEELVLGPSINSMAAAGNGYSLAEALDADKHIVWDAIKEPTTAVANGIQNFKYDWNVTPHEVFTPIKQHYVLMGLGSKFPYAVKEIPVAVTYPEEHEVAPTHESATIRFTPEIGLDVSAYDFAEEAVPEVFRKADIELFLDEHFGGHTLQYRKQGDEEWIDYEGEILPVEDYFENENTAAAAAVRARAPRAAATTYEANLTGLDYHTTYEYRLGHTTGDNAYTDAVHTFTTYYPTGVENVAVREVKLYPNPASSYFKVAAEGRIEIYSAAGALALTAEADGDVTTVNVELLSAGLYLVRYEHEGRSISERLIVK